MKTLHALFILLPLLRAFAGEPAGLIYDRDTLQFWLSNRAEIFASNGIASTDFVRQSVSNAPYLPTNLASITLSGTWPTESVGIWASSGISLKARGSGGNYWEASDSYGNMFALTPNIGKYGDFVIRWSDLGATTPGAYYLSAWNPLNPEDFQRKNGDASGLTNLPPLTTAYRAQVVQVPSDAAAEGYYYLKNSSTYTNAAGYSLALSNSAGTWVWLCYSTAGELVSTGTPYDQSQLEVWDGASWDPWMLVRSTTFVPTLARATDALSDFWLRLGGSVNSGTNGAPGANGTNGVSPTIVVTNTTTLAAGSSATVTNLGNSANVVLAFGIPRGPSGTNGTNGVNGTNGTNGTNGADGALNAIAMNAGSGTNNILRAVTLDGVKTSMVVTGSVTATSFVGDAGSLTNLSGSNIQAGTVALTTLALTATNAPLTNTVRMWLPITIGGTNYFIPLCN